MAEQGSGLYFWSTPSVWRAVTCGVALTVFIRQSFSSILVDVSMEGFSGMTCKSGLRLGSLTMALLIVGAVSLSGCMTQKSEPAPAVVKSQPVIPPKPKPPTVEQQTSLLLRQAERALYGDRLMYPEDDNAYDRYQAVLKLQPGNAQAKSGLQQIVVRYVQMGREALRHSRLSDATAYAQRAKSIDASNPLLQEFEQHLSEAVRQHAAAPVKVAPERPVSSKLGKPESGSESEYNLDVADLNQRGDAIRAVLKDVAERVKNSDEVLLIVARNDAEGRWLYKEMKKAAEGYRIRGDIKVGSPPRIVVYPPI